MVDLESALEQARPKIEKALADAQDELTALRRRESELLTLIGRAEAMLGKEPVTATPGPPQQLTLFQDDDEGFFDWLDEHPDGFFLNAERNPGPRYLVMHQPSCPHFKGDR